MKRRLGFVMAVAATALVGGCDKQASEAPVSPSAAVPQAPSEPSKVSDPATISAPIERTAAPTEAKVEGSAVAAAPVAGHVAHGDEHAGCAGGGAMAAAEEPNCPFPEEKGALEGCGAHAGVAPTKTADGTHFGGAFALSEAKPLGQVVTTATDGQELNVRVSGKIDKVCQKKGCWMVVKDGDVEVRVVMKDHAFTMPLDSQGKPAQVEGLLKVRVFSEAQAKHLAEDGGEDPSKVTGEKKEFLLTATAVEIGG